MRGKGRVEGKKGSVEGKQWKEMEGKEKGRREKENGKECGEGETRGEKDGGGGVGRQNVCKIEGEEDGWKMKEDREEEIDRRDRERGRRNTILLRDRCY